MSQFEQQRKNTENQEEVEQKQKSSKQNDVLEDPISENLITEQVSPVVSLSNKHPKKNRKEEDIILEQDHLQDESISIDDDMIEKEEISTQPSQKTLFGNFHSAYEQITKEQQQSEFLSENIESSTDMTEMEDQSEDILNAIQENIIQENTVKSHDISENVLDREESIVSIQSSKLQFTRPSGRLLSSNTLDLFQEAVRERQIFDRKDVLDKDRSLSEQSRSVSELEDISSEREGSGSDSRSEKQISDVSEESANLLRLMDQSKHTSSLQVRPIHVSTQQSRSWNLLSGSHTLISSSEGSLIVPSSQVPEFQGSFVEKPVLTGDDQREEMERKSDSKDPDLDQE